MKPLILFVCLLLMASCLYSQPRVKDYSGKINDTCWRVDYYIRMGPLTKVESYKDRKKTILHGHFAWYDENGWADSSGHYWEGLREGTWYFYNDIGRVYLSKEYVGGKEVSWKRHDTKPDSAKDAPLKPGEVEAEFEGGAKGWQQYLNRNLRYPVEAIKNHIQGQVRIAFAVDRNGAVEEPWVFKSIERSLDEVSLRLMASSPLWKPAEQDGSRVKSYKIQPVSFRTP